MGNKIISSNNISHDILSRDNYLQYKDLVYNFHSRFDRFTKVLNNTYKEISDSPSYDKRIYNVLYVATWKQQFGKPKDVHHYKVCT